MKLSGEVPGRAGGTFPLQRGDKAYGIRLLALPIGLAEEIRGELGGDPKPPSKGFRRSGRGLVRDPETNQAVVDYDLSDPVYVADTARFNWLLNAAMVYRCLDDASVTFETAEPEQRDRGFYDAILTEFQVAGFSAGEMAGMVDFIAELSAITPAKVEATHADF